MFCIILKELERENVRGREDGERRREGKKETERARDLRNISFLNRKWRIEFTTLPKQKFD